MSDSRVEQDREVQRLEQQRLAQRQAEQKRQGQAIDFGRLVAQKKAQSQQQNLAEQHKAQAHQHSHQRLEARRGIVSQQQAGQGHRSLEGRSHNLRQARVAMDEQVVSGRRAQADEALQQQVEHAGQRPQAQVAERQPGGGDAGAQGEERRDEHGASGPGHSEDAAKLVASGQMATLQAVTGVDSSHSSGGAAGIHTDVQQIINEIVDAVHRSFDGQKFGSMHIELKSHVLSGSSIHLQSTREGVALKIQTPDDEVRALLSSSDTAGELARCLEGRGVKLRSFEVNQERVLG